MTTALPHKNSKFRIFPVLEKISFKIFPIQLEKIPIFVTNIGVTSFLNISEKSFFTFLESLNLPLFRKYKMSSTFFHFREKFLLKNVPLKQNNTFSKSLQLKNKNCLGSFQVLWNKNCNT